MSARRERYNLRVPHFRKAVLAVLIWPSLSWSLAAQTGTHIRVVSGNLSSGRYQSYDLGHGSRILQGLKPDVCLLQEMNFGDKSDSAAKAWIRSVFGAQFFAYREVGELPNGIASRWPIIASGEWDDPEVANRDFAWARIDIPGSRELWVISAHFLSKNKGQRALEATALVKLIQTRVPPRDYVVLGGDLNTENRQEPCVSQLAAEFVATGPFPADEAGQEGTNAKRIHPYDWILADKDLEKCKVPVVIGTHSLPNGLVFDSRVFSALETVAPAQRDDSAAEQMQHMAIVRDFVIPVDGVIR